MSTIGERERITQDRVIRLLNQQLGWEYLGNREEREDNLNIEPVWLRRFLRDRWGHDDALITKALKLLYKAADDSSKPLYDRNREVYGLLRYGIKVSPDVGEKPITVKLIDWQHPDRNHFGVAEEVTVTHPTGQGHPKRPDLVFYVNGIALGLLELKRSTVSVGEGIRQSRDNQRKEFIEHFFSTVQWVMAGNDTQGLRYGTIQTTEKHFLTWKPDSHRDKGEAAVAPAPADLSPLDQALLQLCRRDRFLEIIYDFVAYDSGIKKLCRPHQYYGVTRAQRRIRRREGGIIWHTQGSGKSLTMVWLARWIRENVDDARVLIITDRTELDEQIQKVFLGVNETIYRTTSGADLVATLNETEPWLICSLVHKFGRNTGLDDAKGVEDYIAEILKALPSGFRAKGELFVFVDECHRTQSGRLNKAMSSLLPGAMFIGFTGTPLLRADKATSIETFGSYIHTYKYHEAVADGVVLDLRYEARDIDQRLTSPAKVDQWFEAKTRGLNDVARAQLKERWGTLQKVLSSKSRLARIVADILMDMETRDRLMSGLGNAMLVTGSVYQACKVYELLEQEALRGHCAIITSYVPTTKDLKGEDAGEGPTEQLRKYEIYKSMLSTFFDDKSDAVLGRVEEFEREVKKRFIEQPGQMRLLIVVDKLLTGFDAPPATYLYIDKSMRDHGLFQAICRVNRLDGEDKEYGYIIDYKDLFGSLKQAVKDYTCEAFDAYDREDVDGLLNDRLKRGRERLLEAREAVRALCEPVPPPQDRAAFLHYFVAEESGNAEQMTANEARRLELYKHVAAFVRAFANLAGELAEAGFSSEDIAGLRAEVSHYEKLREEVKLNSGDYVDLKIYEPAMRHLIDAYIQADDSRVLSSLDDLSLIQLIVARGPEAIEALPSGMRQDRSTVAETIENNVRRLIINESPVNPKFYEKMSELLDELIAERRKGVLEYEKYLERIVELTRKLADPERTGRYPPGLNTRGRRALYDNLDKDEALALKVDAAILARRQDGWRDHPVKSRRVRAAIKDALGGDEAGADRIFEIVRGHHDY